ncbi:MAG: HAD-IA family hydrolase [Pseudobacter sp.]|uniref:HAD-IA family hydrolase n=1 Tax=Pseudobacter sp. TaxID=2045420 RepID=UPI003F820AE5
MENGITMQSIDAVLLDMDGTILNSIKSAERVWAIWAAKQGLDVDAFLPTIHGIQSVETIRRLALPGLIPEVEAAAITQAEIEDVEGVEPIPGAAEFLGALPAHRWAIVTSAPRELALRRIQAAGMPQPPLLISAEDVQHGKPAPDCFLLAAQRLGTTADKCLVFEDSPAGVLSGERAGATVMVITTTHHTAFVTDHAAILDYRELAVERKEDGSVAFRQREAGGASFVLKA